MRRPPRPTVTPLLEFLSKSRLPRSLLALAVVLGSTWAARAFPPAPHHMIYGMIRDELGNPLDIANGQVVFEAAGALKIHGKIVSNLRPGVNYQLRVPMDSGLTADAYKGTALLPDAGFRMSVVVGRTTYLPMEMKTDSVPLGQAGAKTRIDLTLGVDSDNDGLPDAWERMLIAELGGGLTLADITPSGDLDGDGLTNLQEYLAGTYAHDPEDGFVLEIDGMGVAGPLLRFTAIRNRTYVIEGSNDLRLWSAVPFRVRGLDTAPSSRGSYASPSVQPVVAEAILPPETTFQFFKLKVY